MSARFLLSFLAAGVASLGAAEAGNTTPPRPGATAPVAPVAAAAKPAAAKPAATPPRPIAAAPVALTYEAFRVISDRNIFNSARTGRRERTEERAPRGDTISLVGTMDYAKGVFAFFDGSDNTYRKALRVGESVAQFKVTRIAADRVDLDRDGKPLTMQISQQLRRPDGGDWTLIGVEVARAEAQAARAAEAAKTVDPSAPVQIPANADPVLRRLMEQRNKSNATAN